jgi:hypothetical protein
VLHWHFSSISNLSQVIHDFYSFKIGPEVVLAARWRPKAKMTTPFESPAPIWYRLSVENFRLCLTVQKLLVCIYLTGNLASPFQNLGFSGAFDPEMQFPINATTKTHFLKANRVVWAIVRANRLSRFCCGGLGLQEKKVILRYSKKSFWGYISPIWGRLQPTDSNHFWHIA